MLWVQKCKWCRKDATKNALLQYNGLCEHCWPGVSVAQELELWTVYAREPQWCQARHPRSGRPCWLQTKANQKECHKAECVKHEA